MDAASTELLRELLAQTQLGTQSRSFGRVLRRSAARSAATSTTASGLLLVGTPSAEPWHLAAHLGDEARYAGAPELTPTWVRWSPPADAPAHLRIGMQRLQDVRRGETVFVVAPDEAPEGLLERVADARRTGATVLAIDSGNDELNAMAHDALVVPHGGVLLDGSSDRALPSFPTDGIEVAQHLVSAAAGEAAVSREGWRRRVARALDAMTGASPRE